jgi:hypothetical protein
MAKTPSTDRDLLKALGGIIVVAEELDREPRAVKGWWYRGIPWKERAKLAELAKKKRVPTPANFFAERRAA